MDQGPPRRWNASELVRCEVPGWESRQNSFPTSNRASETENDKTARRSPQLDRKKPHWEWCPFVGRPLIWIMDANPEPTAKRPVGVAKANATRLNGHLSSPLGEFAPRQLAALVQRARREYGTGVCRRTALRVRFSANRRLVLMDAAVDAYI